LRRDTFWRGHPERISGLPSRRSSLRTHRWSGRTPLRSERRVELAHCVSDGGLQHHAVAELQHIGQDPLLDLTDCGDIVVDPFLGSGSTLSAADKTGRVCRGVELDPLYVDVIVRRFEAATGNPAVLVETGETFEALATQGAGTGVGLRPAPAVVDVADEEREAATGQARGCLHCGGQRFESPQLHQEVGASEGGFLVMMALVGTFAFEFEVSLPLLAHDTFEGGADAYSRLLTGFGAER